MACMVSRLWLVLLLLLQGCANDILPPYGWVQLRDGTSTSDFVDFNLADYVLQIKHNNAPQKGVVYIFPSSGTTYFGYLEWAIELPAKDVEIKLHCGGHKFSVDPGDAQGEKIWTWYLNESGLKLFCNATEVFSFTYPEGNCKESMGDNISLVRRLQFNSFNSQYYRAKPLEIHCSDSKFSKNTRARVSCTLNGGPKSLRSVIITWIVGQLTITSTDSHGYELHSGDPEGFQRVVSLEIPASLNTGDTDRIYTCRVKWDGGGDQLILYGEARLYDVHEPEVQSQDHITYTNATHNTTRPAVCQISNVDNWSGKKIKLEVENACKLEIESLNIDTINVDTDGQCKGEHWKKNWDETNKVLKIQSKDTLPLNSSTPWPLKCSVTIDGTSDGTSDVEYIYHHTAEIFMYPLISVDNKTTLRYNPLKCKLYGVPDVMKGWIENGSTVDKPTTMKKYTVQPADQIQSINCSFEFTDLSQTGNFLISKVVDVSLFTCGKGFVTHDKSCEACEPGFYLDGKECEECPNKTYTPNFGTANCTECKGEVTDERRECKQPCPKGYYRDPETSQCTQCLTGTYKEEGVNLCTPCKAGSVAEEKGSWTCRKCSRGYKENGDRTSCVKCESGKAQPKLGKYSCDKCEGEQYSEFMGAQSCAICPNISYTVVPSEQGNTICKQNTAISNCRGTNQDMWEDQIGKLYFRETPPDTVSKAKCEYNPSSTAELQCTNAGQWGTTPGSLNIERCESVVSREVKMLEENITIAAIDNLANKSTNIAPNDIETMSKALAGEVSNHVKDITNDDDKESLAKSCLHLISNITKSSSIKKSSATAKVAMVTATEKIVTALLDSTAKDDLEFISETFDIKIFRNFIGKIEAPGGSDVSLDTISEMKSVSITVYKDNTLFNEPDDEITKDGVNITTKILGGVIGLQSTQSGSGLTFNLSITSNLTAEDLDRKKHTEVHCKWYNETDLKWSTSGCETQETRTGTVSRQTVCQCNHMTSFAIIMSVKDVDENQDTFSNVMLSIDIICCILTLLCLAPFKVFRQKKLMFIQMQIVTCLLILSISLLVLGNKKFSKPNADKGCQSLIFIIHYLLISLFAWMVCAAFTLKDQIVDALKSYGRKDNWYLVRCMCFCWGAPVLMPSATMLVANSMRDNEPYIREAHCWYRENWLYATVLFPVYCCLFIIFIWYVMVLRVIVNASKNGSAQGANKKTLKAAFAIACTVGLPWIIHAGATTNSVATVLQWCFMISVGLQGPGIFVCAVLLQDEVLSKVCHTLRCKPPACLMKDKKFQKKNDQKNKAISTNSMVISRQSNTNDRVYSTQLVTVNQSSITTENTYNELAENTYNDLAANSSVINEEDACDDEHEYNTLHDKPMGEQAGSSLGNDQIFITHGDIEIDFVGGTRVYRRTSSSCLAEIEEPHYNEFQPPFL